MFILTLFSLVPFAAAHASMTRFVVSRTGETGCAGTASDPTCQPTGGLKWRLLIPREAGSIPGEEIPDGICDWCGLENVPEVDATDCANREQTGCWWTQKPAAHWDEGHVRPVNPCMSHMSFGDSGIASVRPGDELDLAFYVNADHSGLYRFELACGSSAVEDDYMAGAITPWKALHPSKDLAVGDSLPSSRVVGYTRNETDAYFARTVCAGVGCPYRMNWGDGGEWGEYGHDDPDGPHCTEDRADCYVMDKVIVPSSSTCRGNATLRWKWNSAETPQVYANCIDMHIVDSAADCPAGSLAGCMGICPSTPAEAYEICVRECAKRCA